MSTLARMAWGDLTRHRARTLLAVCTLSIAIASLGFLAVPSLLNAAMNRQVADSHLYDVGLVTSTLDLTPAQLGALGRLPGVAAVSPVVGYAAKATSAAGAQNVAIAGTDLASAPVNTVPLLSGRLPGPGEVLADAANGRATDYAVPNGGTIDVRAASGRLVPLRVTGTGINLAATPGANGSTKPVFYAALATVEALRGVRGYNYLGFRLTDDGTTAQNRVITEVRAYLTAQTGTDPITALPMVRAPGQWPGQSSFEHIMVLLYVITVLAFLSALFLIAATMNTLIAEQASEIAILKTLGGRRRQIRGIILRTAAMLGAGGAVLGTIIGIAIAYLLTGYFAEKFVDVSFGFQVAVGVVVASLLLGPALAVAAPQGGERRGHGERCAGRWPRPSPGRPPTGTAPAGLTAWSRAAACCPARRFPAACGWGSATRCGKSAAARPRSLRSRQRRGSPSRCSPSASRSPPSSARPSASSASTSASGWQETAPGRSAARRSPSPPLRRASPGLSPSRRAPFCTTGRPTWHGAWAPIPCIRTG
jgi:hypothetical protein